MISKNQLKQLRALGQKKQRKLSGQFLVQGEKNVTELLQSELNIVHLFAEQNYLDQHQSLLKQVDCTAADETSLTKASTLSTNNSAIAIVQQPQSQVLKPKGITLALDQVSDPGNLGTLIRLADWYGIEQIVLSQGCADPFNPKTISATMGSFCRVSVIQTDLVDYLKQAQVPIYGAFLQGSNVHHCNFESDLILVMGSESHGICDAVASEITDRITIPSFGQAESLNVAMASGIILDNIKRNG